MRTWGYVPSLCSIYISLAPDWSVYYWRRNIQNLFSTIYYFYNNKTTTNFSRKKLQQFFIVPSSNETSYQVLWTNFTPLYRTLRERILFIIFEKKLHAYYGFARNGSTVYVSHIISEIKSIPVPLQSW